MATRTTASAAFGILLLATGCDQGGAQNQYLDEVASVELLPPVASEATSNAAAGTAPGVPAAAATGPQIAYSYDYALETPGQTAAPLMTRHESACRAAGPAQCQVISSNTMRIGSDGMAATLRMRAGSVWLDRFRATLADDAKNANGRIASASTESEDLTRSLSDTGARLRALTTLRDRLQGLLGTRSAPLEQILATERELARVQGELDATQSALTAMQTRVAMSAISIRYETTPVFASEGVMAPMTNALRSSLSVFMASVGALIYVFAALLPLAIILAPVVWWAMKRRRQRRAEKLIATQKLAEANPPS